MAAATALFNTVIDAFFQVSMSQQPSVSRLTTCSRTAITRRATTRTSPSYSDICLSAGKGSLLPQESSLIRGKEAGSDVKFDLSLAVILAGYSFEAYNEPVKHSDLCCQA